ncbi:glutamate transport system permease protein [Kineococcus xinjiangensis]|uniref:Glutamate transport system permease protein n=1 Tax=Kineococcus xinjiangensis TaxID=512762 RepID=A0A2S6IVR6_9ACTN|nr:amino acid ABC transporter permease [Kineococcus xinjiangensis]PPK98457.1 glutamate transport system permease protein [Kineococcus xinjiangensis]
MSAPQAVLFDAPGPRARRRILIASVVAGLAVLALLVVAVLRLVERGQFDAEKWAPLVDPSTKEFPQVWGLLLDGLLVTLQAAALAVVASLLIGVTLAAVRLSLGRAGRMPLVALMELLRGLPVVVTILYVYVVFLATGLDVEQFWALVVGLTLYNCVIIAEITRAGVQSLPKGQVEAGLAVGLTKSQVMRLIQLPQALRAMLPAIISQLVVILKDTALAIVVLNSVHDLMWHANKIRIFLDNPLQTYFVVAVIYILLNLVLDRLAHWTQRRLSRAGTEKVVDEANAPVEGEPRRSTTA